MHVYKCIYSLTLFLPSQTHFCRKAQEELAESEGRRATEALEREALTARKLESVELQLRAERAGREASATQLLKAEDGLGEREAAWEAQRQILVQDAERLREELAEVGRERDVYRLKMEASAPSSSSGGAASSSISGIGSAPPSSGAPAVKMAEYMSERKAYDAEIGELSITCNALREELRMKEDSISQERRYDEILCRRMLLFCCYIPLPSLFSSLTLFCSTNVPITKITSNYNRFIGT